MAAGAALRIHFSSEDTLHGVRVTEHTMAGRAVVTIGTRQRHMIRRALRKHKTIYPCAERHTFGECFTFYNNRLVFWYDTDDKSTHAESDPA